MIFLQTLHTVFRGGCADLQPHRRFRQDAHVTWGQRRGLPAPLRCSHRSASPETPGIQRGEWLWADPLGLSVPMPRWAGGPVVTCRWPCSLYREAGPRVDTWSLATCSLEGAEHAESPGGSGPGSLSNCLSRSRASVPAGLTAGLAAGVDGSALALPPAGVRPWAAAGALRPPPAAPSSAGRHGVGGREATRASEEPKPRSLTKTWPEVRLAVKLGSDAQAPLL